MKKQLPLVASFLLFIALCVSVAYWGMQMFKPAARPVAAPPQSMQQPVRIDAAAALFGGRQAPAAVASNFQLRGVVMSGTPGESVAIVAADGKPATAARIDTEIMPGVMLKSVHPDHVILIEHGVTKRVELPESAKGQSGMMMMAPPVADSPPPQEQESSAGGNPTPGYAGAPPMLQSSPGAGGQDAQQHNGVIRIPAPAAR